MVLSVAILELRMKLNRIKDSELKTLCDALLPGLPQRPPQQKPQVARQRTLLKLVK